MKNNFFKSKKAIKIGDYILKLPPIGEGAFGKVYYAKHTKSQNKFAAKQIDMKEISEKPSKKEKFIQELKITSKMNHINLIKLHDVLRTENNIYLILEYCDGCSLSSFLNDYLMNFSKPPPLKLIQYFTKQIVSGLEYLHKNKSIHRDIKLDNIMINFKNIEKYNNYNGSKNLTNMSLKDSIPLYDSTIRISENYTSDIWDKEKLIEEVYMKSCIKIIDLGFAKELNEEGTTKSLCGTPLTMAPEIWNLRIPDENNNYTEKYDHTVDFWSLGCVVYNLFTGQPPFLCNDLYGVYNKIKQGEYFIPSDIEICEEILDFLNGLIQYNPSNRFNIQEISNHPFLTKNYADLVPFKSRSENESIIMSVYKSEKFVQSVYNSVESCIISNKNEEKSEKNEEKIELSDSYIDKIFINEFVLVEYELEINECEIEDDFLLVDYLEK